MTQVSAPWKMYAYISSAWVDITSDVLQGSISAEWGISGTGPFDRVASTGTMSFSMKNTSSKYAPGLVGALAGWKLGTPIKMVITYDTLDSVRYRGYISELQIESGTQMGKRVDVTCTDWMDYAAKHPLDGMTIQSSQTADVAINAIIDDMPIQPQAKDVETGTYTLPKIFDDLGDNTMAMSEIQKVADSETGYLYIRKARDNGERLTFENAHHRHGWHGLSGIPKLVSDSGFLLMETGEYLLQEDGYKIRLDETQSFSATNTMTNMTVVYGQNLLNRVKVSVYPRDYSDDPVTLWTMKEQIWIGPYRTKEIRVVFSNPTSLVRINGIDPITPVATTDYTITDYDDATNFTSDLTVTLASDSAGSFITIVNTGAHRGYLATLKVRGTYIDVANKTESVIENKTSLTAYGVVDTSLDQPYQELLAVGEASAYNAVFYGKEPDTILESVEFMANTSSINMLAFLSVDVGDMVHIKEDQSGVDGYYFVQSVEFEAIGADVYVYRWTVKPHYSLSKGLTAVATEHHVNNNYDYIDWGVLPQIANLTNFTAAFWVYLTSYDSDTSRPIGMVDTVSATVYAGWEFKFDQPGTSNSRLRYVYGCSNDYGYYEGTSTFGTGAWHHLALTHARAIATTTPVMYLDGAAMDVSIINTALGTSTLQDYVNFYSGNTKYGVVSENKSVNGMIADIRIYNQIVGSADIATLYNGGTIDTSLVTEGLVFQGPCIKTADLTAYTDKNLTSDDWLIDNVYGAIGIPSNGTPVARAL